jgi:hypothetical protein
MSLPLIPNFLFVRNFLNRFPTAYVTIKITPKTTAYPNTLETLGLNISLMILVNSLWSKREAAIENATEEIR